MRMQRCPLFALGALLAIVWSTACTSDPDAFDTTVVVSQDPVSDLLLLSGGPGQFAGPPDANGNSCRIVVGRTNAGNAYVTVDDGAGKSGTFSVVPGGDCGADGYSNDTVVCNIISMYGRISAHVTGDRIRQTAPGKLDGIVHEPEARDNYYSSGKVPPVRARCYSAVRI